MPDLEMRRGEVKVWQYTLTEAGTAVSLTGATIHFTVRPSYPLGTITGDTDATITRNSNSSGIVITQPASGMFEVTLLHTHTNALEVGQEGIGYLYGIEYIPTGETEPRWAGGGSLTIYPDTVRVI